MIDRDATFSPYLLNLMAAQGRCDVLPRACDIGIVRGMDAFEAYGHRLPPLCHASFLTEGDHPPSGLE